MSRRDPDFIRFQVRGERSAELLQEILRTHVEYERTRSLRRRLVGLLAISGALLWLSAFMPSVPRLLRSVGLAAWVVCFPITIVAAVREFRSFKARQRLVDESEKPP